MGKTESKEETLRGSDGQKGAEMRETVGEQCREKHARLRQLDRPTERGGWERWGLAESQGAGEGRVREREAAHCPEPLTQRLDFHL